MSAKDRNTLHEHIGILAFYSQMILRTKPTTKGTK